MLTETHDLRSGAVPWQDQTATRPASDPFPKGHVEVAILGSGIMGAIIAERLSEGTGRLALFDRRPPGCGSTAASTAQIMWAMDVPLSRLTDKLGESEAVRRWRRVRKAVSDLAERIARHRIACSLRMRPTLYLAGDVLDEAGLADEARLRQRHDLPSEFLEAEAAAERFGIARRAGIVSHGNFEVDPVRLCHGCLEKARRHGASLTYPVNIIALHSEGNSVVLEAEDGRSCHADNVILATGYERPTLLLPQAFRLHATFAIATPPGHVETAAARAMIWEASDPYLYVRTDRDGRIIAGGEDVDWVDTAARNGMTGSKAGRIASQLEALLKCRPIRIDRQWSATFGSSPDSLPGIGRSSSMPHVWLAAGFGGNGIAFASLAADLLERELQGGTDPDRECFDPYRFRS